MSVLDNKVLLLSGNNGNQTATHSPTEFSIAFPHPPIHNTMDKPVENLWSVVFLLGEVPTEKPHRSPTRGAQRSLGRRVIAPNLTAFYCRWKRATRAFDFSLTSFSFDRVAEKGRWFSRKGSKQGNASPTRGVEREMREATDNTWLVPFGHAPLLGFRKPYSCLAETKQNKATERLSHLPGG